MDMEGAAIAAGVGRVSSGEESFGDAFQGVGPARGDGRFRGNVFVFLGLAIHGPSIGPSITVSIAAFRACTTRAPCSGVSRALST